MLSSDYTTLAFLAQAIVTDAQQADDFVDAVKRDLQEADPTTTGELVEALDALHAHLEQAKARGPVTLDAIVQIAADLDSEKKETHRVAALALISAVQDLLSRKSRELTLTDAERELAERLPGLARAAS
jgi:hypothetical protein